MLKLNGGPKDAQVYREAVYKAVETELGNFDVDLKAGESPPGYA